MKRKTFSKEPEGCVHFSVNRVIDRWYCNDCGAEFKPLNPRYRTKWEVEDHGEENKG